MDFLQLRISIGSKNFLNPILGLEIFLERSNNNLFKTKIIMGMIHSSS